MNLYSTSKYEFKSEHENLRLSVYKLIKANSFFLQPLLCNLSHQYSIHITGHLIFHRLTKNDFPLMHMPFLSVDNQYAIQCTSLFRNSVFVAQKYFERNSKKFLIW